MEINWMIERGFLWTLKRVSGPADWLEEEQALGSCTNASSEASGGSSMGFCWQWFHFLNKPLTCDWDIGKIAAAYICLTQFKIRASQHLNLEQVEVLKMLISCFGLSTLEAEFLCVAGIEQVSMSCCLGLSQLLPHDDRLSAFGLCISERKAGKYPPISQVGYGVFLGVVY